ncbi:MAG: phenylacetate--CoA ligase family protein, partial [Gemmatimonadota bacterium]|nr:phenylacetate--CoA ligase family protein [Gemmatimonadota bacterium]
MTERLFWSASESRHDWENAQDELATQAAAYGHEHSPEIRRRLDAAGVSPESIRSIGDLSAIPPIAKDDLPSLQASDPPFGGMLAVPVAELRRIYRSPGGITDPEGREEDFWRMAPALWAAGFRPGDVVLNTLSYH